MTLSELEADLYDRLGYQSSPATAVTTRLRRFLNETQREIITMRGCARLRRAVLTFPCVASTPFAVLPQAAVKIVTIQDRTNGCLLDETTLQDLRFRDPGLRASSSNPDSYVVSNLAAAVNQDPSVAAAVFVKSTDAGDTNTAYVEGITTGGYYRSASVVMTGTTAVSLGVTDFIAITKFYISAVAVGTVTLTQTSGAGTELARIPIGRAFARYSRIMLWPTPTTVVTYTADVELHIQDMSVAKDEPYLPEDFHWLLSCGALKKEYTKRENAPQFGIEHSRWKDGVSGLKAWCRAPTGAAASPNRPHRWSQLGSYYPPGT